jgi:hypothetical protein
MSKKLPTANSKEDKPVKGIVTARECECCGHHEIGITTESGDYIQLKTGIVIEIVEDYKHN